LPELAQPGDRVIPGCSTKGGDEDRFKANFEKYAREGVSIADPLSCAFVASGDALSASDFRAALDTGEGLERFIPQGVNPDEILNILGVEAKQEEPIEEISSMAAGSVAISPRSDQFPGLDVEKENRRQKEISGIQTESMLVDQVLDYLLEKLEITND